MTEDMIPINLDDPINFKCSSDNDCFNECCRDLNQTLTPYDILRLKKYLGISSQVFIKKYTSLHHGPESGLPILTFKPNPDTGHACPFVTPKGCSVYEDRPASCRMYPLARAIARSRETGDIGEFFALIEEPHCKGFCNRSGQTVREWLKGQDVQKHNIQNDKLMELISLKNRMLPGMLDGAQSDKFYLALYNLDEFRTQIVENNLLKDVDISDAYMEEIKTHDQALLGLGIEWVKKILFGIQMKLGQ
ncbi:MAG: YkgJ family cysteine cluster protein [Pseudomonadota bacterium]